MHTFWINVEITLIQKVCILLVYITYESHTLQCKCDLFKFSVTGHCHFALPSLITAADTCCGTQKLLWNHPPNSQVAFPWLIHLTDICHLWILAILYEYSPLVCWPPTVSKCDDSQGTQLLVDWSSQDLLHSDNSFILANYTSCGNAVTVTRQTFGSAPWIWMFVK